MAIFLHHFQRTHMFKRSVILLAVVLLFAALTGLFAQDPHQQNLAGSLQSPRMAHWLGSDHLGRDVLARLGEAARVSLGLASMAALLALVMGTALGLLAAWRGGWLDRALSLMADAVAALPALLWVVLVAALAPGEKWALYSGLVLTAWIEFFRTVRAGAASTLRGPQVEAARLLGFGWLYVLRHHVWPPLAASLLTLTAYAVAASVLAVAALGFVGVGIKPPEAELGVMMTEALPYWQDAPWMLLAPVALLMVVVLALQLLARSVAQPLAAQPPSALQGVAA
jgi:peptide/nickel transport system permease protein